MARKLTAAMSALMALVLIPVPIAHAQNDGRVVNTGSGAVSGTVTSTYRTFGNIPFAAAPVGENRWKDPRPAQAWQGVRDATKPSPDCAQTAGMGQPASQTEDCLYLNVTTPAKNPHKPRPVMVWIHGGGFLGGAARMYDARWLATKNDAVVVTVNYRLGVFGFFGYPGLPGSGSFGIADQQAALRWVHRNARAFGGDARNVTVFGESAGGLSVCAQLASPRTAGLFHKAIVQSGACAVTAAGAEPGKFTPVWKPREDVEKLGAAQQLDCADIACLRALPAAKLLEVHSAFGSPAYGTPALPISPALAQQTGRMHRVPVLVGSTHDEGTQFIGASQPSPVPELLYRGLIGALWGETNADKIVARYPVNGNGDARDEVAAILTDSTLACGSHQTRQQLAGRTKVSGYEFAEANMPMIFPDMQPFPRGYRAYHASELPLLFDFGVPLTAGQRELSDYMIAAWGRFARTGDPGWGAGVQSLAAGDVRKTEFVKDHNCEFWGQL